MRLLIVLFMISLPARAIQIPRGLSAADREDVVETIGLGASPKMLTNPYPLGGYSGFEFGYSLEFINVRDINRLGCGGSNSGCSNGPPSSDDEFRFSRFTIGKGLYHDIDVFFTWAPSIGGTNMMDFGGSLRYAFYQAEFLPVTFSAILHGNHMNIQNDFVDTNFGLEVTAGITVDNFSLYFGGGEMWSRGTFLVGSSGNGRADPATTSTVDGTANSNVREFHSLVGFSLQYSDLFTAAEIDHYRDSVYSLKLGVRL